LKPKGDDIQDSVKTVPYDAKWKEEGTKKSKGK
jgi:hypothetical protein